MPRYNRYQKVKVRTFYKCLDCPRLITRGKRCPICGDKERDTYKSTYRSLILEKRTRV